MTSLTPGGKDRFRWIAEDEVRPERALVIVPEFAGRSLQEEGGQGSSAPRQRPPAIRLEEACGLARAISLDVVESGIVTVKAYRPATLMGSGKVEELAGLIAASSIALAIVDHPLSPVQQRNLEKAWNCKVLDRTGLILEIFGERARTKEGRLQVELAHLNYQKGRLVRQWTHLERQRGGAGFMGGPGETQIEADRRELQARILRLERDLEKVRQTRQLHRAKRRKVPHPIIALVGYTNAGKSTLFNRLTGAGVMAKDMLFATLDPTLRKLELPGGTHVILSDTVGFISDLPTDLVAAFRATLEEVLEADLILHVRDIADADSNAQASDVYAILQDLGIGEEGRANVLEVWNKTDLLDPDALEAIAATRTGEDRPFLVSALTGDGLPDLLGEAEKRIAGEDLVREILLEPHQLDRLPQIYGNANVLERQDREDGSVLLRVRISRKASERIAL